MQSVCVFCNRHKGPNIAGIDPKSRKIVPLFNPRRHKWSRHFRWDGPVLVGLTPTGRATVRVLKINLDHRVGFRRELIEEGGELSARLNDLTRKGQALRRQLLRGGRIMYITLTRF